jgi:hypothetical protein
MLQQGPGSYAAVTSPTFGAGAGGEGPPQRTSLLPLTIRPSTKTTLIRAGGRNGLAVPGGSLGGVLRSRSRRSSGFVAQIQPIEALVILDDDAPASRSRCI